MWGGYAQTVSKVTDISNIVSGQKYYIGATTGNRDYYLSLASTSLSEGVKGTGIVDKTKANTFIFDESGKSWTIKIDGTDYYLSLNTEKDNGKVQVVKSAVTFTLSNQNGLIRITKGSYSIQKNNSTTNFGSYANSQKDVWLEPVETSSNKTKTTLTFPQESFSFATTDDLTSFTGQKATLTAEGAADMTGKTITYSKTGNDIFTSFDETTGALVLNGKAGTATVKANFAGDDTYASSTASYTVTVDQVFADLASLKAAIPSKANSVSTAVPFRLKLTDALVTYVNGKKAYVQDATTGVLLFENVSSGNAFGLVAGQKFTGVVDIKACWYNGMAEVTAWTPAADVVKEENVDIPVKTVTLAELNGADYSKYECVRVKVENAMVSTAYSTAKKATIKQGDEAYLIHGEVSGLDVNKDDVCDFIGYPIYWKTRSSDEYQLSVWSQDDIIVKSSVVKTTISFDPATTEYNVDNNNKDAFTAPTATVKDAEENIVEGAAITYTSSEPGVATVGETDGKVTFVGFGTTVITASYAGDATHMASKNSYTINYGKVKTTMDWSAHTATANLGETSFDAPTLTLKAGDVDILAGKVIKYSSSATDVAKISAEGIVTIQADGTTVITATFAGDDTYAEASASYTLTVTDPNKLEVTFDFTKPENYGYGKLESDGASVNIEKGGVINSGIVTITNVNPGSTPTIFWNKKGEITLRLYDNAQTTISVSEGYILKKVTSDAKIIGTAATWSSGKVGESDYEWVAIEDVNSVTFTANTTIKMANMTVYYANATSEATSGTINFIAHDAEGYRYATFSSDKDVVFTDDVVVSGVSITNGKLSVDAFTSSSYDVTEAEKGNVKGYYVPANTGVLVNCLAETATYYFPKTTQTVTLPANQLKPAPVGGVEFKAEPEYKYYKLAYDNYTAQTGLGFYWGAENAGAFKVKAGTAYLAVPASETNNAKGFAFDGETTGVENVNVAANQSKTIYNLNGQRVSNMSQAGLYIVNGKKVVIRK